MALNIPANFRNDIQGRDTNLVPIVILSKVGNEWDDDYPTDFYRSTLGDPLFLAISTNQIQLSYAKNWTDWFNYEMAGEGNEQHWQPWQNFTTKPVLLNIPSLKESIDIEKRNYKISSINIDISNFPYEGKRFSELISDAANLSKVRESLINVECRVFWVSPSTNNIEFYDLSNFAHEQAYGDADAFQVYHGSIRRYDMTDEKVRLVVEDRTQATLHKDLPLENLGTGDEVPEKYKNKPIPMVYGHVDRSPCVIKSSPIIDQWGVGSGNIDIYPDIVPPTINEQYIYFGDKYLPIPATIENISAEANGVFLGEDFAYNTSDSSKIIDTSITAFIRLMSFGSNPIMKNLIPTREYITIDDVDNIIPLREKTHDLDGEASETDVNYTSVFDKENNEVLGTFVRDNSGDVGTWDGTSSLDLISGTSSDIFPDLILSGSSDRAIPACLVETGIAVGDFKADIGIVSVDIPTYYGNVSQRDGTHSIKLSIKSGSKTEFISEIDHSFHDLTDGWHQTTLGTVNTLVFQPFDGAALDRLTIAFWSYASEAGVICAAKFKINSLSMIRYGLVEDIISKDFYANVNGRAMSSDNESYNSTSLYIISHLLDTELGVSTSTADLPYSAGYNHWKYAFTVDKEINSKKLIEGIASASPFIPRFNNMGEFTFDAIPDDGGSVTSDDHTIKEIEVIDFSFSRTKIEDVCTKVIFKYNWDYARGEFNDSVEAEVGGSGDFITNYAFDYYGFPAVTHDDDGNSIHLESTLTIDDDRGKYIRKSDSHTTAQDFANWYLLWSCNQHLKMKIKLPLKYMNLEIGDFVDFGNELLGGVKPYGINYIEDGEVNGQDVFKTFLITSTNKTLEWVEIECVQMRDLDASRLSGCNDDGYQQWSPYPGTPACNYNEDDITNNNCEYVMDCTYDPGDDSTWEDACGGKAEVDFCGVCGGNTVYDDCGDCPGEGLEEDECGVCRTSDDELANSTCLDCSGVPNGNAEFDNCGVCGGENADCIQACDGNWYDIERDDIPEEDECGVCGGDGSTCMQCPDDGIVTLWGVEYDVATTTSINLENQGLSGSIPPEIGCLTNLTYLSLSYNQLSGEIPSSIGDLTNLYSLRLRDNQLIGEIPSEIGQLTNLTSLSLSYNQLTGEIPSEIGNLTNLTYLLYLHNNQLTGEIPPEIGNLTNLNQLWLKNNQLSGEIPPSICNIAGSSPNVGSNLLCPQYFGTENEEYPSCISDSDIEDQDTSGCGEYAYPGDMNGDGLFNVLDVVALVNCILTIVGGGSCPPQGDLNGDGSWNVLDIVQLTNCVLDGNCGG